MRIYLDACCLNRPLDDQTQQRIRLESEAVRLILELCAGGGHRWVSSEAVEAEVTRNPDEGSRSIVVAMLRFADERLIVDERSEGLARRFSRQGIAAADALHLALAESGGCDVLLTTDDDFIRRASALRPAPAVSIENPAHWVLENFAHGT